MQPINENLKPGDTGRLVSILHNALTLLAAHNKLCTVSPQKQPTDTEIASLLNLLREEVATCTYGTATEGLVSHFQVWCGLEDSLSGSVDRRTAQILNAILEGLGVFHDEVPREGVLYGVVRSLDGKPLAGVVVSAVESRLRRSVALGQAKAGDHGAYFLHYKRGTGVEQITVSVTSEHVAGKMLTSKLIQSDPSGLTVVDLTVDLGEARVAEYDQIALAISPLLSAQGPSEQDLPPSQLQLNDLPYLMRGTKLDATALRAFIMAQALAQQFAPLVSHDDAHAGTPIRPAFFFALVRANRGSTGPALAGLRAADIASALQWAIAENVVPATLQADLPRLLVQWDLVRAPLAIQATSSGAITPRVLLGSLEAMVPPSIITRATSIALRNGVLDASSVDEIAADESLTQAERDALPALRSTVVASQLSGGDATLFQGFMVAEKHVATLSAPADVVRLTHDDWVDVVAGIPRSPDAPHPTAAEVATQATDLMRRYDGQFLGEAAVERIEKGQIPLSASAATALKAVLAKNPEVKLGGAGKFPLARALLSEAAPAFAETVELLRVDSLLACAGSTFDVADLQNRGFTSVGSVVNKGKTAFVESLTQGGDGGLKAPWSKDRASALYYTLNGAYGAGLLAISGPLMAVASPAPAALKSTHAIDVPTSLAGLEFPGTQCACASCRSLLSQSAYLAQLVKFLQDEGYGTPLPAPAHGPASPQQLLRSRRPDIDEILLDCSNENVNLSYVDLVNEILERAVASSEDAEWLVLASGTASATFFPDLNAGQALGAPPLTQLVEDLAAAGIRLTASATVKSITADQNWVLEDDAWLIRLTPGPAGAGIQAAPWPQSGIRDSQGASPPTRILAAYQHLSSTVRYPWTLPFDLSSAIRREYLVARGLDDVELCGVFGHGTAEEAATLAGLRALHLADAELEDLEAQTPPAGTALTEADVAVLWGFTDVNIAVADPSPQHQGQIPPSLMGWKAVAARLSFGGDAAPAPSFLDRCGLSLDQVHALLTTGFVNPNGVLQIQSVDPADPASCDLRKLVIAGLTTPDAYLAFYRFVRLARATGQTFADLDRLIAALAGPGWSPTLSNMSGAAWRALLGNVGRALGIAARLKISVGELAVFWSDVSTRIYQDASANSSGKASSQYERLFRSSNALADLLPANAVATPTSPWPSFADQKLRDVLPAALGIARGDFDLWLTGCPIAANAVVSLDALSSLYRNVLLARAFGAAASDYWTFVELLDEKPFPAAPLAPPDLGTIDRSIARWASLQALKTPISTLAQALLGQDLAGTPLDQKILATATSLQVQLDVLWTPAADSNNTVQEAKWVALRQQAIVQALSDLVGLSSTLVTELLTRYLAVPADRAAAPPRRSLLAFLDDRASWPVAIPPATVSPAADRVSAPDIIDGLALVAKVALLIQALAITRDQMPWVFAPPAAGGWMDLNALPVKAGERVSFESLNALAKWVRLWPAIGATSEMALGFYAAVRSGDQPAAHACLAALFDTPRASIDALLGTPAAAQTPWSTEFPKDYWDPLVIARLWHALHFCKRLQAMPAQLLDWYAPVLAKFPERMLAATRLRDVVLGSLSAGDADRVDAQANEVLRESTRAALVDFLCTREGVANANALFARYLIDVEMSARQRTTRIGQAIMSTQLFIDRILMGLEPQMHLSDTGTREWNEWRRWYRVSQANMEIFLYPENWLMPEFRDDKSEFFRELETDLQQSDLTSEHAAIAFGTYLDKLGHVSRLELVSLLNTQDDNQPPRTVTHLFARTRTSPTTYFYRQRVQGHHWTAWETIGADVEGDFLVPVMHGSRLQLLWAIIQDQSQPDATGTGAQKNWKVQFARSRRTSRGWSAKELVGAPGVFPKLDGKEARDCFVFRTKAALGDNTSVNVHAFVATEKAPSPKRTWSAGFFSRDTHFPQHIWVSIRLLYDTSQEIAVEGIDAKIVAGSDDGTIESLGPVQRALGRTGAYGLILFDITSPGVSWLEIELTQGTKPTNPVTWKPFEDDQLIGEYLEFHGGKWVFKLDSDKYSMMDLPIRVTEIAGQAANPPQNPLSPSRDVLWQGVSGLTCSASGAIINSPPDPLLKITRPLQTFHRGMGYCPIGTDLYLSADATANPVLSVAGGNILLLANVDGSGLVQDSFAQVVQVNNPEGPVLETAKGFNSGIHLAPVRATPDVGFAEIVGINTSDGAYLGDIRSVAERARKRGEFLETFTVVTLRLYATHFPRDASLLGAWSRKQLQGVFADGIQTPGERRDLSNTIAPHPNSSVQIQILPEGIEFDSLRASAVYSWEVFLHSSWLIAQRLTENKRFAESRQWYHTVFDPARASRGLGAPSWLCQGLRNALEAGDGLLDVLADPNRLRQQVVDWDDHPFQPFAVGRHRLRSFATAIVKAYVENELAAGASTAQRNTLEAINEATLYFIVAQNILGPRPLPDMRSSETAPATMSDLSDFDPLSNPAAALASIGAATPPTGSTVPYADTRYFCIPPNNEMLDLWARVESSLQLVRSGAIGSLFGPPIDPAILARAAALGLDIGSLLADQSAVAKPYRYSALSQKAQQFCGEVKALGSAMLAAIEKRDAEQLSLLRSGHEIRLAELQGQIRSQQVHEAHAQVEALQATRSGALERLQHFRTLLAQSGLQPPLPNQAIARIEPITIASQESFFDADVRQLGLSRQEVAHLTWSDAANDYTLSASIVSALASALHLLPGITTDGGLIKTEFGGSNLGFATNAATDVLHALSANASYHGMVSSTLGGHERRRDDWAHQHNVIAAEIEQLDKQIAAATIRSQIAQAELDYQSKVVDNAQEVDQFLRSKFSSEQLYHWMVNQLSSTYFRAYQVALELAGSAQAAFDRELAPATSSQFIQPSYWDSLRQGLLAADQLSLDLMRMDAEYLRTNVREFELTKHISLANVDPLALIALRLNGKCTFKLPETLFDLDFPGHVLRRVRTVSVSVPCVVGPYSGVPGTLTLNSSFTRHPGANSTLTPDISPATTTVIAISSGQTDSGLFDASSGDGRYLPFEGAGVADSEWTFELPSSNFRPFDYESISDLILHVRYTARDSSRAATVIGALGDQLNALRVISNGIPNPALGDSFDSPGLWRCFSLRREFPALWNALSSGVLGRNVMALTPSHFSFLLRDSVLDFLEIRGIALCKGNPTGQQITLMLTPMPATEAPGLSIVIDQLAYPDKPLALQGSVTVPSPGTVGSLQLSRSGLEFQVTISGDLSIASLEDCFVCIRMSIA